MTLPEVCPRDGVSQCKKAACHLYVIDWRSGDEQCIIGYGSTHKGMSRNSAVVDTYAERTRLKREASIERTTTETSPSRGFQETRSIERKHLERTVYAKEEDIVPHGSEVSKSGPCETRSSETIVAQPGKRPEPAAAVQDAHIGEKFNEKVVSSDKDTTLIESASAADESQTDRKKRKSIDDVMNMDLPDNYEEEFWK